MAKSFSSTSIMFITMVTIITMFVGWSLAIGRNPTPVEHNACRVKWSEHVNEVKRTYKDDRARVVAINVSGNLFVFFFSQLDYS